MLRQEFIYIYRFVKSISSLFHVFGAFRAISRALCNFTAVILNGDSWFGNLPSPRLRERDGVTADTDRCNKPSYSG